MKSRRLAGLVIFFGCLMAGPLAAGERIYLMSGQSNMMGLAKTENLDDAYKQTPANVSFHYQGRPRPLARNTAFGPEVSFAHAIARAFPNDQHIIVKFAATGSHIQQWLPGQDFYKGMLRQLGFSVKQEDPEIAAIFWMQGESDAFNEERATQYAERLGYFIRSLRHDLKAPDTPFFMGEINPKGRDFPLVHIVQEQQRIVVQDVPDTLLIPEQGVSKIYDHIHFNAAGQVEMGKRYAAAYIRWVKNEIMTDTSTHTDSGR